MTTNVVICFRDINSNDIDLPKIQKRGGLPMTEISDYRLILPYEIHTGDQKEEN